MKQPTERFPHIFTVKALGKLPGLFKAKRYLYYCARCKWSFIVNDGRRGVLTPVSDNGSALTHEEAVARAATFAAGPCPALRRLSEAPATVSLPSRGSRFVAPEPVRGAKSVRAN
jgi:hypothetical protein